MKVRQFARHANGVARSERKTNGTAAQHILAATLIGIAAAIPALPQTVAGTTLTGLA